MSRFNFGNSTKLDVEGAFGGLYVLWNNDISVQTIARSPQELYLFVKVNQFTQPFMITAIYSKPYSSFKTLLWDNLKNFYSNYLGPHLVLGDFNDIIYSTEKFGVLEPSEKRMLNFRLNLEACNMLDLGFLAPDLIGPTLDGLKTKSWSV